MDTDRRIRNIIVVGGGTAGWIAAAGLARNLSLTPGGASAVTLIESEEIGTVGVGEATIPTMRETLRYLRIDENDFMRRTQSTYKLAIRFEDWRKTGEAYWHPFGNLGPDIEGGRLFQHWIKARNGGAQSPQLMDLSIAASIAEKGGFAHATADSNSPLSGLRYAYHFDAGLVAKYLREHCEKQGVRRVEGRVVDVEQRDNGFISALTLADGTRLEADFFIDCTGFRAMLIEGVLKSPYEDWTKYLPCDRAIAAPTAKGEATPPYTLVAALNSGWRWRIPLQHRVGNGYVYSSQFIDDDDAREELLAALGEEPIAEPRLLRFKAGRRKEIWRANCLSLGLASGFLEPLESTSIHLMTATFFEFLKHFPDRDCDPRIRDDFNKLADRELVIIRDFLVLHYCLTQRDDTAFWRHCASMEIPETLQHRIDLYKEQGRLFIEPAELFSDISWISVLEGMGVKARRYDAIVDCIADTSSVGIVNKVASGVKATAERARSHNDMLAKIGIAAGADGMKQG